MSSYSDFFLPMAMMLMFMQRNIAGIDNQCYIKNKKPRMRFFVFYCVVPEPDVPAPAPIAGSGIIGAGTSTLIFVVDGLPSLLRRAGNPYTKNKIIATITTSTATIIPIPTLSPLLPGLLITVVIEVHFLVW